MARVKKHIPRGRKRRNKGSRSQGTVPGRMTPRGRTRRGGHNEAVSIAAQTERRYKAWRMLVDLRLTYAQIGEQLGVSSKTICLDIHAVADELKAETKLTAEEYRDIEVRRTHQADRAVMAKLHEKGSAPFLAHERLIASSAHRSKLLGLYPKQEGGISIDQVVSAVRAIATAIVQRLSLKPTYDGIEARRIVMEEFRRQGLAEREAPKDVEAKAIAGPVTVVEASGV